MVTTDFHRSFVDRKTDDEGIETVEDDGEFRVLKEGVDHTGFYGMSDVVENTVDAFGLDVDEAIDMSQRFHDFGGKRRFTDRMAETAARYSESYNQETLGEITEMLRAGEDFSAGEDLWNFLQKPEADILAEDAEEELHAIGEVSAETGIEEQIEDELNSEYREAALQAYHKNHEKVNRLGGLGEITGHEVDIGSFDTFKWLKDKQYNPNWSQKIDTGKVSRSLANELDTIIRARTLDALEQQAHNRASMRYEQITGSQPGEVTDELVFGIRTLKMSDNTEIRQTLREIIEHDRDSYFQSAAGRNAGLENIHVDMLMDGVGRETYEVAGREIDVYVASPLESLRYGEEFQTCKSIAWENGDGQPMTSENNSEMVHHATSLENPIIFAEDDGNIVGREMMIYVSDDYPELRSGRTYTGMEDVEANRQLREAIEEYQNQMRAEMGLLNPNNRSSINDADTHYAVSDEWYAPEHAPRI